MEHLRMIDIFNEYKYDSESTKNSPVIVTEKALQNYNCIVRKEGGKTALNNIYIINMDVLKDALKITPTPSSMDIIFVASRKECISEKFIRKYIIADFKFNITAVNKVDSNISNDSIRKKYKFTKEFISEKDSAISCLESAYFIFKDKNFEQIKNAWNRRNLNFPKTYPIKQSDFEKIFQL